MKFFTSLALFGSMAAAVSIDLSKRDSPLSVEINVVDNTNVEASITNNGDTVLKILKTGSILDETPVEKTSIFAGSEKVPFDGISLRVSTTNLAEDSFQIINPGETITATWDVAEVHDLSPGGFYDIAVAGVLSYAEEDSNDITGVAPLTSNVVSTSIDGTAAAKVRRDFHAELQRKRSIVQSDCTGSRLTATRNAITNCRSFAARASTAAASGAASKLTEYFKSSTSATRSTVAGVFARVATECGSTTSGVARYYCSDVYGACGSNVLAYTLPSASYMVNCPLFFTGLPALSSACHAQDQATTVLHEVTHLTQIKGTTDYSCYGYNCVRSLSSSQNLNHADTYTLFAQALYAGC